jgi:hypothetical protein
MTFQYKEISLFNLFSSRAPTSTVPSYSPSINLTPLEPTVNTPTIAKPYPVGFQYQNADFANTYSAYWNEYNITSNVSTNNPIAYNHISAFIYGGGGGGGGGGGVGRDLSPIRWNSAGDGGNGGQGGYAAVYQRKIDLNFNTLLVTIGQGGTGGGGGAKASSNSTNTGSPGNAGLSGNATSLQLFTPNSVEDFVLNANGGVGGAGGAAGEGNNSNNNIRASGTSGTGAYYGTANSGVNGSEGNAPSDTGQYAYAAGIPSGWPSSTNLGLGGTGGAGGNGNANSSNSSNSGSPGLSGYCRVWWLYDGGSR